jgi:hypothetical protein
MADVYVQKEGNIRAHPERKLRIAEIYPCSMLAGNLEIRDPACLRLGRNPAWLLHSSRRSDSLDSPTWRCQLTVREAYKDPFEPIADPSQERLGTDDPQGEPTMPDPFPGTSGDDQEPVEMPIPAGDQSF